MRTAADAGGMVAKGAGDVTCKSSWQWHVPVGSGSWQEAGPDCLLPPATAYSEGPGCRLPTATAN